MSKLNSQNKHNWKILGAPRDPEAERYWLEKEAREYFRHYYKDESGFEVVREHKVTPPPAKYVSKTTEAKTPRRTGHKQRAEGSRSSAASGDSNSDSDPDPEPERPQQQTHSFCRADALATLGFAPDSEPSPQAVQSAFRKAASSAHPDRGGTTTAMRDAIAARDYLLPAAQLSDRHQNRRRSTLESPEALEMQAFSDRIGVDITDCWLALGKIRKQGLSLDDPKAAKLAREEKNRKYRETHASGFDVDAESLASSRTVDADLSEQYRAAVSDSRYAPDQSELDSDDREQRITTLLALSSEAIKPRDQAVVSMRFEDGLSIAEIAEKTGKTDKAIYAAFARITPLLQAAYSASVGVQA